MPSRRIQRLRKALIIAGSIAATVLAAGALMMGSVLSAPALRSVGDAPPDLNAADVSFDGVKGWFVAA
ncbi:MAG TPA: hypothetical protein VFO35_12370, partial [Steroidobacteraceae bacterium]|nr:hypothetical protein [Steroidobacteraceae bacterium]